MTCAETLNHRNIKKGAYFFPEQSSHTCNCHPSLSHNMSNNPLNVSDTFWLPGYYDITTPYTCGLVVSIQNILLQIPTTTINIKNDSNKENVRIRTTISMKMVVETTSGTMCVSNIILAVEKVVEFDDAKWMFCSFVSSPSVLKSHSL